MPQIPVSACVSREPAWRQMIVQVIPTTAETFGSIYLFLAVLGLHCCAWASSCGESGYSRVVVCELLIEVASPVAAHRL